MIGFVTWPPFCTIIIYVKGGQVTKPIMHGCEIPCEHVFEVKRFFNKQLAKLLGLTELLVADSFTMLLLLGLALFLHPRCFV